MLTPAVNDGPRLCGQCRGMRWEVIDNEVVLCRCCHGAGVISGGKVTRTPPPGREPGPLPRKEGQCC